MSGLYHGVREFDDSVGYLGEVFVRYSGVFPYECEQFVLVFGVLGFVQVLRVFRCVLEVEFVSVYPVYMVDGAHGDAAVLVGAVEEGIAIGYGPYLYEVEHVIVVAFGYFHPYAFGEGDEVMVLGYGFVPEVVVVDDFFPGFVLWVVGMGVYLV